jgi:hypothetical protein
MERMGTMEIYVPPHAVNMHINGYLSLAAKNGPQSTKESGVAAWGGKLVDFPLGERHGSDGEGVCIGNTFLTVKYPLHVE